MELILGSASPRRRDLLVQIGVVPSEICAADIDESPHTDELPRAYAERLAREKGLAVAERLGPARSAAAVILTADTVVSVGRRILEKPADRDEAEAFLALLSGRRHRVITAVALRHREAIRTRAVVTRVKMKRLSEAERAAYLRSGDWQGKAGGYGIQGLAAAFIPEINGSYTNVVGLPLTETMALLTGLGYPVTLDGRAR